MVYCLYNINITNKGFIMNFLGIISGGLVGVAVLCGNASAKEKPILKPTLILAGSYLIQEKKAAELFGEEYISARKQVFLGKAIVGGVVNVIPQVYSFERYDSSHQFRQTLSNKNSFVGYVVVNSALRCGSDYLGVDEYIDKKCDELFSKNGADVAKIIAPAVLDMLYNYLTIDILKGIMHGIDTNR